jgi:DNA invertase Pin-like site-specific DNA recombinase
MKAIAYIRVSTTEQAETGISMDAQRAKIKAYCELAGLELVDIIAEEGVSGSKPLATRPGGMELIKQLATGEVKHIISMKLDRLFRDAEDALMTSKAWDKAGIALHLIDMGGQTLNTATAMGRFFLNMMAGFAELERNLIAERTRIGLQHLKATGQVYGPTPVGYDRSGDELTPNHRELSLVTEILEKRAAGYSLRKIADELNTSGTPTKAGGKWHASTIKYITENALYA